MKVIKSIPLPFLNMLKEILTYSTVIPKILDLKLGITNFVDKKCKFVRNCLVQESYPGPIRRDYIFQHLNRKSVNEFRCKYLLFPLPPKYKEVHFKILYDIYLAKEFLRLRFNVDCNICQLCNNDVETVEHLFLHCNLVNSFWTEVCNWIKQRISIFPSITWDMVKFGVHLEDKSLDFVVNCLLLMLKYFIHKCKVLKTAPQFIVFKNELAMYIEALKIMRTDKAKKLFDLFNECDFV